MSAPAIAGAVDPSGIGGERVSHSNTNGHVCEIWVYSSHIALEAIRAGWLEAFPRGQHFTGVQEFRLTAGRRFVQVDRYDRAPAPKPHIEEPDL